MSIGGFVLTWEGRQLKSFGDDYEFTNYTYNADGIRTVKEYGEYDYNGYRHEYTLNGSQIVREVVYYDDDGSGTYVESYMLVYIYDETGAPIGMKYRTPSMAKDVYECFFFEKNLQGDIVSVYNSAGVKVIAYTYDAWGNCTTSYPNGSSGITGATYNPFRYRGYYYDIETGFYYLQSRYYNPGWGRFLNADGYISTGAGLLGYNIYSYCNNNPIIYVDSEGTFPWLALLLIAGVVVFSGCSDPEPPQVQLKNEAYESYEDALAEANDLVYEMGMSHAGEYDQNGVYCEFGVEYNVDIYYNESDGLFYLTTPYTSNKINEVTRRTLWPNEDDNFQMIAYTHYHPYDSDMSLIFSTSDINVARDYGVAAYIVNANKEVNSNLKYMHRWKQDVIFD